MAIPCLFKDFTANSKRTKKYCMDLKICVIGDGGAGKSALTVRFMEGHFTQVYDPTVLFFTFNFFSR